MKTGKRTNNEKKTFFFSWSLSGLCKKKKKREEARESSKVALNQSQQIVDENEKEKKNCFPFVRIEWICKNLLGGFTFPIPVTVTGYLRSVALFMPNCYFHKIWLIYVNGEWEKK